MIVWDTSATQNLPVLILSTGIRTKSRVSNIAANYPMTPGNRELKGTPHGSC